MEITGKVLREVEFRDRLRGYDFEEVDEFLEQVAVAVDAMQAELASHRESLKLADDRIVKAEALIAELESQEPTEGPKPIDDEGIKKTLMLAQRTADMAIAEAKAEADKLLSTARIDAEKVLSEADEYVKNMKTEAEKGLSSRIESLTSQHDQLIAEIKVLNQVLKAERARLTEALNGALRFVSQAFPMSDTVSSIAENGKAALGSLLGSDKGNSHTETEDAFGSVDSSNFNIKSAHIGSRQSDNGDQSSGDAVGYIDGKSQNTADGEVGVAESEHAEAVASDDSDANQTDLTILPSANESQEFSSETAIDTQYHGAAQRDDGIVDSLLQDMFESLGQDNDDEIMWARFTSSSMDVNVAKSNDSMGIASDSSEMSDQGGGEDVQGEVLQFERNKKQPNN